MENLHGRLTLKAIDANGYYVTHVVMAQDRYEKNKWVIHLENGEVSYTRVTTETN